MWPTEMAPCAPPPWFFTFYSQRSVMAAWAPAVPGVLLLFSYSVWKYLTRQNKSVNIFSWLNTLLVGKKELNLLMCHYFTWHICKSTGGLRVKKISFSSFPHIFVVQGVLRQGKGVLYFLNAQKSQVVELKAQNWVFSNL